MVHGGESQGQHPPPSAMSKSKKQARGLAATNKAVARPREPVSARTPLQATETCLRQQGDVKGACKSVERRELRKRKRGGAQSARGTKSMEHCHGRGQALGGKEPSPYASKGAKEAVASIILIINSR